MAAALATVVLERPSFVPLDVLACDYTVGFASISLKFFGAFAVVIVAGLSRVDDSGAVSSGCA